MNKKGQINLGVILIAFIGVVVGVALLLASAQSVGDVTNTIAVANSSIGAADNDTAVYFTDYRAFNDVVMYNVTGAQLVPANNYTVTNNVVYNGALAVKVQPNTGAYEGFDGYVWNISATAQPLTYIDSSGGRAMAGLVIIFFALAVAVVALSPVISSKVMEIMGK